MGSLTLSIDNVMSFINKDRFDYFLSQAPSKVSALYEKSGAGSDFLGWVTLPSEINHHEVEDIIDTATKLQKKSQILVVVGIGGSYLGSRAIIEALSHNFKSLLPENDSPVVLYAGQNIGEDYLYELLETLNNYDYSIVVISKSGTTTEPAIAFRLLKRHIEKKYGKEEACSRIVAITDAHRGALLDLAQQEGYKTFVIPDNVGGRFSVLTPVGLLPIAVAGFDIKQLIKGAQWMQEHTGPKIKAENNPAAIYAAVRNTLYEKGKILEILVNYTPRMHFFSEWWKQLYGESEGKNEKGIFPVSVDFTTDLHSLGQYIQDGQRLFFETVLTIEKTRNNLAVPSENNDADGLNYLSYKPLGYINQMAALGTLLAHVDGGVPVIQLELSKISELSLGKMIYFFEMACGISGYLLGVNPFDQPGVEAYKRNMFALLGKPGFEQASEIIRQRIEKLG